MDNLMNEQINKAIDAKKYQTREALKEVEKNTRMTFLAHVDYHKFLMEEAKKRADIPSAIHHQVMMETYEAILKNYSMSGSYDTQ